MRSPRHLVAPLLLALLSLAVLTPATRAADPDQQSAAAYAKQAKARLATYRATLKMASAVFAAAAKGFDAQLATVGDGDDGPVEDLVQALELHREALSAARDTLLEGLTTDAAARMDGLAPGQPGEAVYPKGFLFGDGGTSTKVGALAESLLAKEVARAAALVRKSANKLRAKSDARLALATGQGPENLWAPVAGGYVIGSPSALRIEFVLGLHRADTLGDGRFWASGTAGNSNVAVGVYGVTVVEDSVAPDNGRWRFEPVALPEGNYLLHVFQGDGSVSQLALGLP